MSPDEFIRHLQLRARDQIRQAAESSRARRARVLRYPDLAKKLTEPPLNIPTPEMWTGYVPPADGPYGGRDGWKRNDCPCNHCRYSAGGQEVRIARNDSPQRAALVDICAEALRREQEEASEV